MTLRRSVFAFIAVAAVLAGSSACGSDETEDPGVAACRQAADRAASGTAATTDDDKEVQMLIDSEHADLREVGEVIRQAMESDDLTAAVGVGVQMQTACAAHGVTIKTP